MSVRAARIVAWPLAVLLAATTPACLLAVSTDGLSNGAPDASPSSPLDGSVFESGASDASDGGTGGDAADARTLPPGARVFAGNGHAYLVVIDSSGVVWPDARFRAAQAGGHLATISDAAENAFVLSLINEHLDDGFGPTGVGPWLGGYQPMPKAADEPDGGWQWVDGTPWGYTDWNATQPDNSNGTENNLDVYLRSGVLSWNDDNPAGTNSGTVGNISYVVEFE